MIYNVSGVTCQLGNFCLECMTPHDTTYTFLGLSSILNIVIAGNGNGNGREWE